MQFNNLMDLDETKVCNTLRDVVELLREIREREFALMENELDKFENRTTKLNEGERELWNFYAARVKLLDEEILPYLIDE